MPTILELAYTVKPTNNPEPSEPVVAPNLSKDMPANSSKPSRSQKKSVKSVPSTQDKLNRKLACFIIEKYINSESINWGRDTKLVYKLIDKFPEPEFWYNLPVLRKVDTAVFLWAEKARKRLSDQYLIFKTKLQNDKVVTFESEKELDLGEKVGEDYKVSEKRQSMLEFCK